MLLTLEYTHCVFCHVLGCFTPQNAGFISPLAVLPSDFFSLKAFSTFNPLKKHRFAIIIKKQQFENNYISTEPQGK